MTPDSWLTLAALTLGFIATIALGREQRRRREADVTAKILRAVIHDYRKRIHEAPLVDLGPADQGGMIVNAVTRIRQIGYASTWPGIPVEGIRLVLDPEIHPRDGEMISGDPAIQNLRAP